MVEACPTCGRRVRWTRLIDLHRHAEAHDAARSMGAGTAVVSYSQWIASVGIKVATRRDPVSESRTER